MNVETDILPPRYRSVRPIAHGGMGDIYRATDESLARDVAVKVLADRFARDEALRTRFRREALAAARLSGHPHTVTIYDVGEWEERPYIVMEHVPGGTVADRLGSGPVDAEQVLAWIEQAAEALDAAHEHGVVHRDVKPQNLLVGADGELRVADFGIASAAGLDLGDGSGNGARHARLPGPGAGAGRGRRPGRRPVRARRRRLRAARRNADPYQDGTGPAEAAAAARGAVPAISQEGGRLPRVARPGVPAGARGRPGRALRRPAPSSSPTLRRALDESAGSPRAVSAARVSARPRPTAAARRRSSTAALARGRRGGGGRPRRRRRRSRRRPRRNTTVRTVTGQGEYGDGDDASLAARDLVSAGPLATDNERRDPASS